MSTTNSPAASKGENVSEIQVLTQRVLSLNQSTDWWNTWMIVALVFAALSAVAVVGTTVMALKRAKQAGDAQADLMAAKDRQSAEKIADAKQAAAEATARAVEAQLALEKFKAPRNLTQEQQHAITERIRPFAGTTFEVYTFPGEPECVAFASQITAAVTRAGWKLMPIEEGGLLGVASGVYVSLNGYANVTEREREAATSLVSALEASGVTPVYFVPRASLRVNPRVVIKIQVAKKL